jgi:iron complex transport system permease protein
MPTRHRAILILSALCLLAVGSFMLALMVGSFKVAPADVLARCSGRRKRRRGGDRSCACRAPSPVLPAAACSPWPAR